MMRSVGSSSFLPSFHRSSSERTRLPFRPVALPFSFSSLRARAICQLSNSWPLPGVFSYQSISNPHKTILSLHELRAVDPDTVGKILANIQTPEVEFPKWSLVGEEQTLATYLAIRKESSVVLEATATDFGSYRAWPYNPNATIYELVRMGSLLKIRETRPETYKVGMTLTRPEILSTLVKQMAQVSHGVTCTLKFSGG